MASHFCECGVQRLIVGTHNDLLCFARSHLCALFFSGIGGNDQQCYEVKLQLNGEIVPEVGFGPVLSFSSCSREIVFVSCTVKYKPCYLCIV